VIFAAALPLACLLRPGFRHLVLTWKIFPAAALAALLVLPTILAVLHGGPVAGESVESIFNAEGGPGLGQIAEGTFQLAHATSAYPMPFLAILIVVMGLPLWRGLRARVAHAGPAPTTPDLAFIGTTVAIGLLLTWAPVLLVAATEFKVRFLYPALFIAPVFVFMIVERGQPSRAAVGAFALILAALAVAVPIQRLFGESRIEGASNCWPCKFPPMYTSIATELRAAGYDGAGTILTDSLTDGGNLRVHFPEARIVMPPYPLETWPPPKDDGPCLILWHAKGSPASLPASQSDYLADPLHGDPAAPHRGGSISARVATDEVSGYRLAFRLYDAGTGDCR
jgi:hypothetical protein